MSRFIQFAVFLLTFAIVIASVLLSNMDAVGGGGAVLAADNPLYTPSQSSLSAVLDADSFDAPVYVLSDGLISYRVGTSGGSPVGAVFVLSVTGWNPGLIYLVGVDSSGTISGVEIIQQNETPDFWEIVADARFYRGLVGNTAGAAVDTVSGATRTSYAIFRGADTAADYFNRNVLPTW